MAKLIGLRMSKSLPATNESKITLVKYVKQNTISDPHSGDYEDACLPGCTAV
jgi:hypothetical protein